MQVIDLRLSGLKKIVPRLFKDVRGYFFESYRQPIYASLGIGDFFVQDNVSLSQRGTIRALHFQAPPGQAKLVSCLQGKIWDVAVDVRSDSPTFGQWEAVELDDESCAQIYIPAGFAHGFCVLSESAKVHYKTSTIYDPQKEISIRWNDPDLKIAWPVQNPILSPRDQISPYFKQVFDVSLDSRR